jgi:hypothetical protein
MRVPSSNVGIGGPRGLPSLSKNCNVPSPRYVFPSLLRVYVKSPVPKPVGLALGSYVQTRRVTGNCRRPLCLHTPHAELSRAAGVKSICPLPIHVPSRPHNSKALNEKELSGAWTTVDHNPAGLPSSGSALVTRGTKLSVITSSTAQAMGSQR